LVAQLESQIDKVASGDLTILEQTLAAQTYTLNALFHMLLRRSGRNMGVYTQSAWEYMKLALRAQAQCRSTVEALAEMKKPRPEILRQTNIAHGHQQVNNQLPAIGENPPNELMEQQYERLDPGTPSEAVKGGQAVETVGEEHGAEND